MVKKTAPGPEAGSARTPLSRETWIAAATAVLEFDSVDAIRVDVLARQLQVTRGSFYWHFKDREDLLRAVLQAWRATTTENLTRRLEGASSDPREQLRDVLSLPHRGRSAARVARIELAIRAWARRDDMARLAVDEADASRLGYIAQIFSSLGLGPVEARQRAVLAYSLDVACSMFGAVGAASRPEELQAYAERLLGEAALAA
jgi:AcrR family transcriptional regulator